MAAREDARSRRWWAVLAVVLVVLPLAAQACTYWVERRSAAQLSDLARRERRVLGHWRGRRPVVREPAHEGDAVRELLAANGAERVTGFSSTDIRPSEWRARAPALDAFRRAASASTRSDAQAPYDDLSTRFLSALYLARARADGGAACLRDVVDVIALREDARAAGIPLVNAFEVGQECAGSASSAELWQTASDVRRVIAGSPTRAVARADGLRLCGQAAADFERTPPAATTLPGEWRRRFTLLGEARAACASKTPDPWLARVAMEERAQAAAFVIALEALGGREPRAGDPFAVERCGPSRPLIVRREGDAVVVRSECQVVSERTGRVAPIEIRIARGAPPER